jgi:HlyD family secretion protein
MRTLGLILAILAIGGGGWYGYSRFVEGSAGDDFVLEPLERGTIIKTVSATGTIEPVTKVIVGSQVSGNILNWYADFNDPVTEGFVLAELDPDRFQTAYKQAMAEVAIARAGEEETRVRYDDAERERARLEKLMERGTASENEWLVAKANSDAALAAWHGAQAQVEAAEARLASAKVDLDRTIIRSPIDGVVISRTIDVGQTVAASLQAPELFLIANNLTHMRVNANVAEADVGLITEGRPANFRVDAYPERVFEGVISQIRFNATIVDGVVTYVTLIDVMNDDLALRPGMTANVTVEVAKAEDVIRIPNAALRFSPLPPGEMGALYAKRSESNKPKIWIVADGKPRPVEIETGLSDGSYTQLVQGDFEDGDEIIVERNWIPGRGRADPTRSLR